MTHETLIRVLSYMESDKEWTSKDTGRHAIIMAKCENNQRKI